MRPRYNWRMHALKTRVKNGRILVDEPTDLPEGTELDLVPSDDDAMTDEQRVELDALLLRAFESARTGKTVDAATVLAELGVHK